MRRMRQGQSTVEYMLTISVIAIGLAAGFLYLTDSVKFTFGNASDVVVQPYP
jgi:Flp pilus assembly pilin Flp